MQPTEVIAERARARIETDRRSPGLSIGLLTPTRREVLAFGVGEAGAAAPVEPGTLFEIGSITKVFTGLLLADAVLRGELSLDAQIQNFLPAGIRAPVFEDQAIRLSHLANHSAGLPSFLDGAPPFGDDLADYSQSDLLADFAAFELKRAPGAVWAYSNTGYGLLGVALEAVTGRPYETLLHDRILGPLDMTATAITLPPALDARAATPHGADQWPISRIILPSMASAGAIWSDAADMVAFLAAAAGHDDTPLAPAFEAMLQLTGPRPGAPMETGFNQVLAWMQIELTGGLVYGHTGGTVGMGSAAFIDPATREAVVVLTNAAQSPLDFAVSLMREGHPLREAPTPERLTPIADDPAILSRLSGRYASEKGVAFTVTVDGKGLIVRPFDAPGMRMSPFAPGQFFSPSMALRASFNLSADGPAESFTFTAGPQVTTAKRVA